MDSPDNRFGLALALAASALGGISLSLEHRQKKRAVAQPRATTAGNTDGRLSFLSKKQWWLAVILLLLRAACTFASFAYAPAILVTPLVGLSVIISAVLLHFFSQERLLHLGKIGCILAMLGSVILILNTPEEEFLADPKAIWKRMGTTPGFVAYMVIASLLCAYLIIKVAPAYGRRTPFIFTSISAIFGSFSVIAIKGLGLMIRQSAAGEVRFHFGVMLAFIALLVPSIVFMSRYLAKAREFFQPEIVAPIDFIMSTMAAILATGLLFHGWQLQADEVSSICPGSNPMKLVTSLLGIAVICMGVYVLHWSSKDALRRADEEEESVLEVIAESSHYDSLFLEEQQEEEEEAL